MVAVHNGKDTSTDATDRGNMPGDNPLETMLRGFVAIYNDGPDGLAVGGASRDSAERVREFAHGDPAVVNIKRARDIARDTHDWDITDEDTLRDHAMRGTLP